MTRLDTLTTPTDDKTVDNTIVQLLAQLRMTRREFVDRMQAGTLPDRWQVRELKKLLGNE